MPKTKKFVKTDLSIPCVEHEADAAGHAVVPADAMPPSVTSVQFPPNPARRVNFKFGPWYGLGIDAVTYACQRQVERFLLKQDSQVEPRTVASYCEGLAKFLDHLAVLRVALNRDLTLADIGRPVIDSYLVSLRDLELSTTSQKTYYKNTKPVLQALGRRRLFNLVSSGDDATFPANPFPGVDRKYKGETPLSIAERKAFTAAVKTAVMPWFTPGCEPTGELVAYALLVVALHTGRNTTPLLELPIDCIRAHPKDNTAFLVVYKRRGHTTSKVILRGESKINRIVESTPTLRPTVLELLRRVIAGTEKLREEASPELRDRVWIYRSQSPTGGVTDLGAYALASAITKLVDDYKLLDADGKPLKLNVSRLRKTFVNRLYELLDGNVAAVATAAGNSTQVTGRHYLRPTVASERNWAFMGKVLVQELLAGTVGATARTPLGQCSDPERGEYAPKRDGSACSSFLNCLRCRNYVVTGDDLWRLFSFYFRILREHANVDRRKWRQQMAHIPRLIDRDVIEAGIARGVFKASQVEAARERARHTPHPFWSSDSVLHDIEHLQSVGGTA
ncbi:MAG: hypothetical protein EKK53_22770 [Burkholderiales bacterium]|jgi:hypothetical protein|nr:MAG: hypothetical protein EKK53_22770 [Burkholderiales bacterium]